MERVLVFCGSSPGRQPVYTEQTVALGRTLAERHLGLVYGGASVGLMGALADATLQAGGEVIGVIPSRLVELEIAHAHLTELRVVDTMHERKALMSELADAVIALPGGTGTLDELFELFTWSQLGLHHKPIGLLDVAGYWQPLMSFLEHAVNERFLRAEHRDTLLVETDPGVLLDRLASHQHREVPKWIDREAPSREDRQEPEAAEPQVPNTRSPASPSPGRM